MLALPVRPRVLFSRCLERDACRYDGGRVAHPFIKRLRAHVDAVDVCPEVAIGLGTPRPPIRLVTDAEGLRLIQPDTGRDLTSRMTAYTAETVAGFPALDGAILKSRSPSCGLGDTKHYDAVDATTPSGSGHGLFAQGVVDALPGLVITDDTSLDAPEAQRHFLARLFGLAWVRETSKTGDHDALSRLRHLLALDEVLHRHTLEAARRLSPAARLRAQIDAALTQGPSLDETLPPLYPTALVDP